MKKLIGYSFVLIMDKGLSFISPLLVLYLTENHSLYVGIESALAISVILIPIIDFGVKDYIGYVYTKEGESCFSRFDLLSFRLIVINLLVAAPFFFMGHFFLVYIMALFRSVHINIYYYLQMKGRLTEKIIDPLRYSILVSIISVLLAVYCFYKGYSDAKILWAYFFSPPILFLAYHISRTGIFNPRLGDINFRDPLYWAMVKFSMPIIINSFLVIGFSNLTKLYVLNKFGENEMVRYSFDFRIAMVIQMIHLVVVTYLTKFLLISNDLKKILKLYTSYAFILFCVAAFGLLMMQIFGYRIDPERLAVDPLMCAVFGYTIFWCLSAFFDIAYARLNKTSFILINSSVFFVTYIIYYLAVGIKNPTSAAVGLLTSSFFMLVSNLSIIYLNRVRFKKNADF